MMDYRTGVEVHCGVICIHASVCMSVFAWDLQNRFSTSGGVSVSVKIYNLFSKYLWGTKFGHKSQACKRYKMGIKREVKGQEMYKK